MSNSNDQVAHIWVQQVKQSAKSSNGNFSFEGQTLYSYSTPIARFVPDAKGKRCLLVTSRHYSMTTSGKHMPALRNAVRGREDCAYCFTVPNLGSMGFFGYSVASISADDHAANLAHFVGRYANYLLKAKRAREFSIHGLPDDLESLAGAAQAYAKAFKLKAPKFNIESDAAELIAYRAERDAKNATPEAAAKRAKAKEGRERALERKAALARLEGAEKVAAWRAGASVHLGYGDLSRDASGGALLRVRGDKLETSQGASVPLEHAIKVFKFVKLCRDNGKEWQRNGHSLRVGHFQVDHVRADGSFRAGCHLINWPEIETAALMADVAHLAGQDTSETTQGEHAA